MSQLSRTVPKSNARPHIPAIIAPCPLEHARITVFAGGRLGNMMGEYATLYANSRLLGIRPYIRAKMQKPLKAYFPSITIGTEAEDRNRSAAAGRATILMRDFEMRAITNCLGI